MTINTNTNNQNVKNADIDAILNETIVDDEQEPTLREGASVVYLTQGVLIDATKIRVNWKNNRKKDFAHVVKLAISITEHGLTNLPVVRAIKDTDEYELISGFHTISALELLQETAIMCNVASSAMMNEQAFVARIATNTARKDFTPMQLAKAIKAIKAKYKKTYQEIAGMLGLSMQQVSRANRLNSLIVQFQALVDTDDKFSFEHALETSERSSEEQKTLLELWRIAPMTMRQWRKACKSPSDALLKAQAQIEQAQAQATNEDSATVQIDIDALMQEINTSAENLKADDESQAQASASENTSTIANALDTAISALQAQLDELKRAYDETSVSAKIQADAELQAYIEAVKLETRLAVLAENQAE